MGGGIHCAAASASPALTLGAARSLDGELLASRERGWGDLVGGCRLVRGPAVPDPAAAAADDNGGPVPLAHGAAVAAPALVVGMGPPLDQGADKGGGLLAQGAAVAWLAWVGARGAATLPAADEAKPSLTGWLAAWTEAGGGVAVGSWSKLKREPRRKCCTTGNLDRTSASYIFSMPLLILPQPLRMPEMS